MDNIIDTVSKIASALISIAFLIVGLIGIVKGWWKGFKKINTIADKTNLFIDNMVPDLLGYLSRTSRAPSDALEKWTKLISSGNVASHSPLKITEKGFITIKDIGIDKVFEKDKDAWVQEIQKNNVFPATKYDIESMSIKFVAELFQSNNASLDPIKNYLYEHPTKVTSSDLYALFGLLLRDYIFDKYPSIVK